jgi:ABC-type bacteriocin/lantibiotic exporter with double-glycine peptidase domain
MDFNVPYYQQSSEFTCGPACVLMVMKHFEPKLEIGRSLEFEIWRQCNMIGIKGADPYGLTVPLIDAGYAVRLLTKRRGTIDSAFWKRRLHRIFSAEEIELSLFGMKQNWTRARSRHLHVTFKRPVVTDVVRGVSEGFIPIALVHMGVVHSLNIPHWVVVTDADHESVFFNDPYRPKGRKGLRLSHTKFQKILDDIGTRIGLSPSILFVRRR